MPSSRFLCCMLPRTMHNQARPRSHAPVHPYIRIVPADCPKRGGEREGWLDGCARARASAAAAAAAGRQAGRQHRHETKPQQHCFLMRLSRSRLVSLPHPEPRNVSWEKREKQTPGIYRKPPPPVQHPPALLLQQRPPPPPVERRPITPWVAQRQRSSRIQQGQKK